MTNKVLISTFVAALSLQAFSADRVEREPATPQLPTSGIDSAATRLAVDETQGIKLNKIIKKIDPSVKFGGYIVGKYSSSDRSGQATDGGFDLRFIRLYLSGYCFQDFFYRIQMEVNGAPGVDKGPRVLDAFVEWQHFDFLKVKMGQFKRSFGFENPYSPLNVGFGSYSQATMKLQSIGDRIGEHKSSGRDLGLQLQGDFLPVGDSRRNLVHYQIGVFNGQGINHTDKDHTKDVIGGLWLNPIDGLSIGGFGWTGRYVNEAYKAGDASQLKEAKRVRWSAGMKYEKDWTLRGEYVSSVGGVVSNAAAPDRSDAWYATVGVPVVKNLKIYGRWDCYRDAKTWGSLKTNYGIAANWFLGKNLIFQFDYAFTDDRSASVGQHYNTVGLQVYARF